jgi:hypothetical protein
MIILKAIATPQEITCFVREHTAPEIGYTVTIIDEGLHDVYSEEDVAGVYSDGSLTLDLTYGFLEGNFYAVQIYAGTRLIGFHKIYVTDQTDYEKYSVLNSYYQPITKDTTDYIVKPSL